MCSGIAQVYTSAQYRNGAAQSGVQGTLVGFAVNTVGQSTGNPEAVITEYLGKLLGNFCPGLTGLAAAHHGHLRLGEYLRVAAYE